jgi:hypothetical protein
LSKETLKEKMMQEVAMWCAEIGKVPQTYTKSLDERNRPESAQKRRWKMFWSSWGAFIYDIERKFPDLVGMAEPEPELPPEIKDPLEALRASTTEKTYE